MQIGNMSALRFWWNTAGRGRAWACGILGLGVAVALPASPTLSDVTARALAASPELQALTAAVEEQAAQVDQAKRWQNPSLDLEKENFAGSRAYRGSAMAEYTATLDQTIEVGGKRKLRTELATADLERAELALDIERGVVTAEARRRFVALQLAQAEREIAREKLATVRSSIEVVQAKRGAGASGGLEEARTQVAVSMSEVELEKANRQLAQAQKRLANLWGGSPGEVAGEVDALTLVEPAADASSLQRRLIEGPRWRLIESWQTSQSRLTAAARASAWPDVSVRVGHRWFEEGDDNAWLLGVSVPFPLFDRNADGIRAARAGEDRVRAEASAQQRRLRESLDTSLERVRAAYAAAARLETETLPLARRSYALVEEGYRLGQYELLYLLEAQQTLFTVEAGVAGALGELHFALSDLDELLVTTTSTSTTAAR